MSERRSHWDIDLVDGVGRRLIPRYRSIGYCTDAERHRIYTLIEFVEDWQNNEHELAMRELRDWKDATKRNLDLATEYRLRAERAEAQVQAVREACADNAYPINDVPTRVVTVSAILAALDEKWDGISESPGEAVARLHALEAQMKAVRDVCDMAPAVMQEEDGKADDGQRLDVNALLSARMEQVERAKRAEAEVERLNRIISESKPWIDMADELADAQATIQRVREVADDWDRLAALLTSHGVRHDLDVQHAAQRLDRALDGGDA